MIKQYDMEFLPEVGDIVRVNEGPFGDAIVVKVEPSPGPGPMPLIHLERPHMAISGSGGSSVIIMTERFTCSSRNISAYVSGKYGRGEHGIDNRSRN